MNIHDKLSSKLKVPAGPYIDLYAYFKKDVSSLEETAMDLDGYLFVLTEIPI